MAGSFKLDTSDFDERFKKIAKTAAPELMEKGMGRAMLSLLGDCVLEVPTVPLKEGWLRGSGSIFVNNKFVGDSSSLGKPGRATSNYSESKRAKGSSLEGVIGFNTPYAARLHEGIGFHFTEPSSGPKYLESKMLRNGKSYMKEIADTILEGSK